MIYTVFIDGNYLILEDENGKIYGGHAKDVVVSENGNLIGFSGVEGISPSKRIVLDDLQNQGGGTFTIESFRAFYRTQTGGTGNAEDNPDIPDVTPPSVPTELSASTITFNSLTLDWNASTDDESVAGYKVFQDGVEIDDVTGTSLDVTGLNPETSYTFAVSAYDESGNESPKSSSISVTTVEEPDTTAPSVPAGLSADNTAQTTTELSWSDSTDDTGVANYIVYQDGAEIATPTATNYNVSGLVAATEYSFTVSAIDAAGNESAQSAALAVTTLAEPEPEV